MNGLPRCLYHWGIESACTAQDAGVIPGLGRFPWSRNGNSLQYSCLGNPRKRGYWWVTVHEVAKESDTTYWLNNNNASDCSPISRNNNAGIAHFIVLYFIVLHRLVFFVVDVYKWKVRGSSTSNKSNGTIFPAAFAHFVTLCLLLVILTITQKLLIVNIFSTVICDQWFFFLIKFYWNIVALQCCVTFYYTAKWISYAYTYIPSILDFLPI